MRGMLARLAGRDDGDGDCECRPERERGVLVLDASDCPGDGRLAAEPACRATAVESLDGEDARAVVTRASGLERAYEDGAAGLLVAASRFRERARFHDASLARRAARDPLAAGTEAAGRAGPVARIATDTGLAERAGRHDAYEDALRPYVGPEIARSRVAARPPARGRLAATRDLPTGASVRVYDRPDRSVRTYHLTPREHELDPGATATLAAAYQRLAGGGSPVTGPRRPGSEPPAPVDTPGEAVAEVADPGEPVEALAAALRKHTGGFGVLTDLFADGRVSDVFATAPVTDTPLWVRVDDEPMRTNVRLTRDGAGALASRVRRASGRAFSRASPTVDASVTVADRRVRVAGLTEPASDGVAFAFRADDDEAWTLPALVGNDTLTARAAAVLSVAVRRGASLLVAGPRSAGKTTLLGALLWEVPPGTRTVVIEDTPELPVDRLLRHGRDVQGVRSDPGGEGLSPTAAVRTALRLGDGALAVGEIRGEEAGALYEAMRVGANDGAVMGTIHGDGGPAVRERVVSDLGVPASSFGATDLLVTLERGPGGQRRVRAVEEVVGDDDPDFAPLFERAGDGLVPTGRVDRGNSALVARLAAASESYADCRARVARRADWVEDVLEAGRTAPADLRPARAAWTDGTEGGDRTPAGDPRPPAES